MATEARELVRVAIIDDQHLFRDTLGALLEESGIAKVVCSMEQGSGMLEAMRDAAPAVVIIGLDAQKEDPIVTAVRFVDRFPGLPLCAIGGAGDVTTLQKAIAAGCGGALSSDVSLENLEAALRALADKQPYVDPALGGRLLLAEFQSRDARRNGESQC